MSRIEVGDFVKGISPDPHSIAGDRLAKAVVPDVMGNGVKIKVLEHEFHRAAECGYLEPIEPK